MNALLGNFPFLSHSFLSSCGGKEADPDLTNVKVDELGVLVSYVTPEIPPHEAVPPIWNKINGTVRSKNAPRARL